MEEGKLTPKSATIFTIEMAARQFASRLVWCMRIGTKFRMGRVLAGREPTLLVTSW
jgi:hypothetical protein